MLELHPEFLTKNGRKEFAVLPYEEFLKVQELLEDLEDLQDLREAKQNEAESSLFSLKEVQQILDLEKFEEEELAFQNQVIYDLKKIYEEDITYQGMIIAAEPTPEQKEAYTLVSNKTFRKYFCIHLTSVTEDIFELGKSITPILILLSTNGNIQIPKDSLLYAWITLLIFKTGIKHFCQNYLAEAQEKQNTP